MHGATPRSPIRFRAGYSLVELVVVVGLIAVLASAGLVWWPAEDRGTADRTARALLRAQVDAARARAVLHGRPVVLAVAADAGRPERYGRLLVVADPIDDGARWQAAGPVVVLPGGVRLRSREEGSSLLTERIDVEFAAGMGAEPGWGVRFDGRGRPQAPGGGRLLVGPENDTPALASGRLPSGVEVSRYGVVTEWRPETPGDSP